jgi:probable F420-dependent oxidoreductase
MPVHIGLISHSNPDSLGFAELAQKAEALGFESLWCGEHTAIPVHTATPYPGGGPMPDRMKYAPDPLVALAVAAGATRTLRLGTGVCLVPEHEPILLAKQVATLDMISRGRFLFGIGAGWIREESEVFGVDFPHRWKQTREHVQALQALWTQDAPSFSGEYVKFPALWSWPKPAQKPHPPILIAGAQAKAADRIAEYGDGWMPHAMDVDPAAIEAGRKQISAKMGARGRSADTLDITLWGGKPDREDIRRFGDAGVTRYLLVLGAEAPEASLRRLEGIAEKVL